MPFGRPRPTLRADGKGIAIARSAVPFAVRPSQLAGGGVMNPDLRAIARLRGEPGFDEAVLATSFGEEDPGVRPHALVRARSAADVSLAVLWARGRNWKVACCSGGHAWSQNHIRDGGLLIDLSALDGIAIDPVKRSAEVGPGCVSGDLDAALSPHGLFFPVAHAFSVGMGGFLLQGGFGWNSRMVGLGCDNVTGADVVLADGMLIHANHAQNEDVFWALRGSGTGFFGIVTKYYLALHKRPGFTGIKMQVFRLRHLEKVVRWANEIGPQISSQVEFQMVVNRRAFGIFSHGIEIVTPVLAESRPEAKELVAFIDNGPLRPAASLTLPLIGAPLGSIMKVAEKVIFPTGTRWHADNVWLDGPVEQVIPVLREAAETQPGAPSHILWLNWNPAPRARDAMAFSIEARTYLAFYGGLRGKKWQPSDRDWATKAAGSLMTNSVGSQLADENLLRRPARVLSEPNLSRLEALRTQYDPARRFFSFGGN